MKRRIAPACALMLGLVLASTASAGTYRVLPDGSGDFATIQLALAACACGDTILVTPGVFHERLLWPDEQGMILMGEGSPEECIIDGDSLGRVITIFVPVDETTVIKGLTICNGGTLGGIGCNAGAGPTIEGNIVRNCQAENGGGIGCDNGSSPQIIGNNIHDNQSANGAGIAVGSQCAPTIADNWIHDNTAGYGGGIVVDIQSNPTITDNLIENNTAVDGGGGVFVYGVPSPTSALIANNEIRSNHSLSTGGIALWGAMDVVVRENLIVGNTSDTGTGGVSISLVGNVSTITLNQILENSGTVSGGVIVRDGAMPTIEHNVIHGNIGHGIACANAANPLIQLNEISGHTGFYGVTTEHGLLIVAEFNWWGDSSGPYHPTANPTGTGDWVSDYVDFDPWLNLSITGVGEAPDVTAAPVLHGGQPNPFNPRTVVAFTVPTARDVRLTVHALDGSLVATLHDGPASAGRHEAAWGGCDRDGRAMPSGVYVCRLTSGSFHASSRMVLIR